MGALDNREKILKTINEYEKLGKFNTDVEEDAPAKPITPKDVDYTVKKVSSKFLTALANKMGKMYFESMIKHNKLIIKDVVGLENARQIQGGAIITCNHFNIVDNYIVYKTLKPALKKKQYIFKVIKDSNYTNFKGVIRLLMRHANTLPLSSNIDTMKEFNNGVSILLNRGEKILIYPEKAMWWNYRKPRPLVLGAFKIAIKNNVPVLPIFITMKDSDLLDDDGLPIQEHYVHILPPIYPNKELPISECAKNMSEQNYKLWTEVYESFYGEKLNYLSEN